MAKHILFEASKTSILNNIGNHLSNKEKTMLENVPKQPKLAECKHRKCRSSRCSAQILVRTTHVAYRVDRDESQLLYKVYDEEIEVNHLCSSSSITLSFKTSTKETSIQFSVSLCGNIRQFVSVWDVWNSSEQKKALIMSANCLFSLHESGKSLKKYQTFSASVSIKLPQAVIWTL